VEGGRARTLGGWGALPCLHEGSVSCLG
jgi:hypothetical protein